MAHRNKGLGKKPKPHAILRTKRRYVSLKELLMNGRRRWWKWMPPFSKEVSWNA